MLVSNSTAHILLIYGDQDQFTAEGKFDSWSRNLEEKGQEAVTVQKVAGADHFWHGRAMNTLEEVLASWLKSIEVVG